VNLQSMLWSLWKMECGHLSQDIYRKWVGDGRLPCVLELGLLAMESAWGKDRRHATENELQVQLMRAVPVRLMRVALWRTSLVPEAELPPEPPAMPPCDALGLSEQECRRYLKLARFVQYLEFTNRGGSPQDILDAVECFPKDSGRWLKVAGGDKAVVLWDGLRRRPTLPHEVAVEFGALVGYTTVRLGALCRKQAQRPFGLGAPHVVSCELDSVHACVARHAIDLAGVSGAVEVWIGQVRDLVPRLLEELGGRSTGFLFMDQRGTAFHEDLLSLEQLEVLGVEAKVAADNCLKPGAPFFVWHVQHGGSYNTTIWTMGEFASEEIEDWMVVSDFVGRPLGTMTACPDRIRTVLGQLAWETDNMRAGAERGVLHNDDWIAFSQYMLRYFALIGIEATPWVGLPEPEGGYPDDMPLDNRQLMERIEAARVDAADDLLGDR